MKSVSLVVFAMTLAGITPIDAGSATAAAPAANPFAGDYLGDVPTVSGSGWSITISKKGAVQGVWGYTFYDEVLGIVYEYSQSSSFTGSVDANGNLSIAGSQTYTVRVLYYRPRRSVTLDTYTSTFAIDASVAKDANGDLVVTDNTTGATAVWARQ